MAKASSDDLDAATRRDKAAALHLCTPLVFSAPLSVRARRAVYLKLENIQPGGSFKIRGIGHLCVQAQSEGCTQIVCSSGGNAGAAAAYAGKSLGLKVTIVVPSTTPQFMRERLTSEGAELIVHGDVWDDADREAVLRAEGPRVTYVPPFDHPAIWEGHSTLVDELHTQMQCMGLKRPGAVVLSVGGGGLFIGVAEGMARCGWHDIPILAAETDGAASFAATLRQRRLVKLPAITSLAKSLGARIVSQQCLHWIERRPVQSYTCTDAEAVEAVADFATLHRYLVEPACGAALAAACSGEGASIKDADDGPWVVVVCGGNMITPELLQQWLATIRR